MGCAFRHIATSQNPQETGPIGTNNESKSGRNRRNLGVAPCFEIVFFQRSSRHRLLGAVLSAIDQYRRTRLCNDGHILALYRL